MSILNISEVDGVPVDGGGMLAVYTPNLDIASTAIYNDMLLNGVEVDGGYVAWHPVVEAHAIYPKGFIATKFGKAFLWLEKDGATSECLPVPEVPDEACVPEVPDAFVAPAGGKPC